jgi:hypothetical protein
MWHVPSMRGPLGTHSLKFHLLVVVELFSSQFSKAPYRFSCPAVVRGGQGKPHWNSPDMSAFLTTAFLSDISTTDEHSGNSTQPKCKAGTQTWAANGFFECLRFGRPHRIGGPIIGNIDLTSTTTIRTSSAGSISGPYDWAGFCPSTLETFSFSEQYIYASRVKYVGVN